MIDNSARIERMTELLSAAFTPTHLDISDDSHEHAGHAGAKEGKGHFTVTITSDAFDGSTLIARHKQVYKALGDMMETDIHALSIKANTPAEAS